MTDRWSYLVFGASIKAESIFMHCPNCGQSQPSEDIRYCSRCGLSLWELARWLNDGANAPWAIQPNTEPSPRRKGIRRGAKLMFISGVVFLPTLVLALAVNAGELLLFPLMIFFAGLVWALYSRLFADAEPAVKKQIPAHLHRANEYLPPAQANPASVLRAKEPNTAEIVQPPSVTEYTTNLLKNRNKT
jgi:hypothetical protein